MRTPTLVLAAALLAQSAAAAHPAAGFWKGSVEAPERPLEIMIEIEQHDGVWRATFYAPQQGIRDAEMTGVEIRGAAVTFRIPKTHGEPTLSGAVSEDGESIHGTLTQAGVVLPFHLTRAEKPDELKVDVYEEYRKPGAPGEGLEGAWRAVLMTGPNRIRLALQISSTDDGTLLGSLDGLDQGVSGVPVTDFYTKDGSVRFVLYDIGARYEGTMKSDGSEFTGVWIQSGQEFPVTFRRRDPASDPKQRLATSPSAG